MGVLRGNFETRFTFFRNRQRLRAEMTLMLIPLMITPSSLIQPTGFTFASTNRPWSECNQGPKSSWERETETR